MIYNGFPRDQIQFPPVKKILISDNFSSLFEETTANFFLHVRRQRPVRKTGFSLEHRENNSGRVIREKKNHWNYVILSPRIAQTTTDRKRMTHESCGILLPLSRIATTLPPSGGREENSGQRNSDNECRILRAISLNWLAELVMIGIEKRITRINVGRRYTMGYCRQGLC